MNTSIMVSARFPVRGNYYVVAVSGARTKRKLVLPDFSSILARTTGRRRSLFQPIDLAPTCLEYFDVDRPVDMQGGPLRNAVAISPITGYPNSTRYFCPT